MENTTVNSKHPTGTPLWWIDKLETVRISRLASYTRYDNYYEGVHRIQFSTSRWRAEFGELLSEFRDNWCDLVVDAVEERLDVTGFRFAEAQADQDAWRIWQQNQLDSESQLATTEALINGRCPIIVWRNEALDRPSITVEDPQQVVVAYNPADRTRRAALKRWCDDDGAERATLYLPDEILRFRQRRRGETRPMSEASGQWIPVDVDATVANPLGVVPVVELRNRPRVRQSRDCKSEIANVIPVQDAINKTIRDALVASEFQGFRQRWATGIDIPEDPDTGQPVEPFKSVIDRMFIQESSDAKFGEFGQVDMSGFTTLVEMLVQHVASQTRTPPHYFYLRGQFPSGESIKSAETGLVAKARRRMRHFGEAWEEIMRLAFAAVGDTAKASTADAETIWRDPESRSESEHVDAVLKRKALGVPVEQLWADAGYSPQQIVRMREMVEAEAVAQSRAALTLEGLLTGGSDPDAGI